MPTPLIIAAANRGDVDGIRRALAAGTSPNARLDVSGNGGTPLHCVCYFGTPTGHHRPEALQDWVECVRLLLAAGADPNVRDDYNDTVLHDVVQESYTAQVVQIVNMLLAAGADVTAMGDGSGVGSTTPLHNAAMVGSADTVELLLGAKGASAAVNMRDNDDDTPLDLAVYEGNLRVYPLLLRAGADLPKEAGKTLRARGKRRRGERGLPGNVRRLLGRDELPLPPPPFPVLPDVIKEHSLASRTRRPRASFAPQHAVGDAAPPAPPPSATSGEK